MRKLTIRDVVIASSPDNVVASPYEGKRYGSIVIINIPKPKPVVRWMKLARMLSKNMLMMVVVIVWFPLRYFP